MLYLACCSPGRRDRLAGQLGDLRWLGQASPTDVIANHSGKAAVDLFVGNGARVVAVDLTEPTEPEGPYPTDVEFVKGSVV